MSEPKTIYLATRGEYSDYRVCHAFTRREDAEAYPLGDDVKEMELKDGPVDVREWHHLAWHANRPDREASWHAASNPIDWIELRDFDGDERRAEHTWSAMNQLTVEGWDKQLVMKVYSEQRAQYLARQEGVS
jgi:hypothetical protein